MRPTTLSTTVHEDATGKPRVLFVINPTTKQEHSVVELSADVMATDVIDGTRYKSRHHTLSLLSPPRSVRMLRIDVLEEEPQIR